MGGMRSVAVLLSLRLPRLRMTDSRKNFALEGNEFERNGKSVMIASERRTECGAGIVPADCFNRERLP